jgi:hypothetical protein
MSASYFQIKVQKRLDELAQAALHVPMDVPERGAVALAKLQGQAQAFREMLELIKKAVREDIEADDEQKAA